MAGYIGTKAVSLSTTAADVSGDATIDGTLTVGTGVDVTGTVTADGLTVDGSVGINQSANTDVSGLNGLRINDSTGTGYAAIGVVTGDDLRITSGDAGGSSDKAISLRTAEAGVERQRLRVAGNGDISFYEDTGTTPKFFWDASAEALGIGTSSPDSPLNVVGQAKFGDDAVPIRINSSASTGILEFGGTAANRIRTLGANPLIFDTNSTERLRIDASGNVGIGTTPDYKLHVEAAGNNLKLSRSGIGAFTIGIGAGPILGFADVASGERMRIDASGNLLVGKTDLNGNTPGFIFNPAANTSGQTGYMFATNTRTDGAGYLVGLNRQGSDGDIIEFRKANAKVGSIGVYSSNIFIGSGDTGLSYNASGNWIGPCNPSTLSNSDNFLDLGAATVRFDDVYATNGTIQTSDANEKQQIAELTAAEMQAAKAISKLFKTFKWNDSVAEKGDDARIHSGVIAQEVEAAMTDAGLDAGRYAFFISSTWWESTEVIPAVEAVEAVEAVYEDVIIPAVLDEEGNEIEPERTEQRLVSEAVEAVEAQAERTVTHTHETAEEAPIGAVERNRKGIRYPQLLSFIGAATEQRLASIEARLDTLEGN